VDPSSFLRCLGNYRFPTELDSSKNRFRFTGYIFDKETGLYHARARYFDPQLGKFLTQGSYLGAIDSPPSLHRYLYASNNPTRYVDLTGRAFTEAQKREIFQGVKQRVGGLRPCWPAGSAVSASDAAAPLVGRTTAPARPGLPAVRRGP